MRVNYENLKRKTANNHQRGAKYGSKGTEMPYSGPKMGSKMDQNDHDLEGDMAKNQL